jgi:ankyrin repeat protein
VRVLAEYIPVNSKNLKKETPLHCDAYNGIEKIVAYLLMAGAERNLEDLEGQTILRLANKMHEI